MTVIADLHMHTNNSDGIYPPKQLVKFLKQKKIQIFSITDHDTINGIKDIIDNCSEMTFIPGIEFSCEYKNKQVHILGYMKNYENVLPYLEIRKQNRIDRAKQILDKLREYNINLNFNELLLEAKDAYSIGRPHIARIMLRNGYISNIREAFDRYIGDNKPCYVKKMLFPIDQTVKLIHDSKGIASLAHPSESGVLDYIDDIKDMGIDGIEVYTPKNDKRTIEVLKLYCLKNNLLITGGSDFHGDYEYTPFGIDRINADKFMIKWEAL